MLLIGIGVWVIAVILIIMFFRGASEKEVILRPLDMEKSKIDTNLFDEMRKCYEEDEEFLEAIMKYDIDNAIEEFWDSVQTKLNVMSMIKIPVDMVYRDMDKHIKKMHERGYVFKE
ncbi:hypothetical protein NE398_21365 [Clostridium tertium]|jgi:phosphoribosyl-ATP pyrophosphohydrolase|uniref:Uncharacterized protein n=1 Tax=Clostridium tertium TaxID=1559 RepID=A0A9X3XP36_9CLOT|nr:hypothetical protein [Clostridium tertium]MDC4242673.1 hypothetical protein [Clostridium tertium]